MIYELYLIFGLFFYITIRRCDVNENNCQSNLGFTVVGYCPCQVGKVDKSMDFYSDLIEFFDLIDLFDD